MTHVHVCAWRWEKHREDFKAQGFNKKKKKKQTKGAWKGLSYTVYEITELKACHVFITLVKWHRRNRKMVINKADIGWCQCSPGASMSPWYADPILNYVSHKVEKINNVWLMRHLTGKKIDLSVDLNMLFIHVLFCFFPASCFVTVSVTCFCEGYL